MPSFDDGDAYSAPSMLTRQNLNFLPAGPPGHAAFLAMNFKSRILAWLSPKDPAAGWTFDSRTGWLKIVVGATHKDQDIVSALFNRVNDAASLSNKLKASWELGSPYIVYARSSVSDPPVDIPYTRLVLHELCGEEFLLSQKDLFLYTDDPIRAVWGMQKARIQAHKDRQLTAQNVQLWPASADGWPFFGNILDPMQQDVVPEETSKQIPLAFPAY